MTPNPEKHLHNPEFAYTPALLTCLRAKWDRDFPGWNKPSPAADLADRTPWGIAANTGREVAALDRAGTTCASAGVVETREQVRQPGGRPGRTTGEAMTDSSTVRRLLAKAILAEDAAHGAVPGQSAASEAKQVSSVVAEPAR